MKYNETKIIKDLEGTGFRKSIDSIWNRSKKDFHPFQKGDSHQASEHCCNVLDYLSTLINTKDAEYSKLDKYLLCCSAILHDIDKAIINYDHEVAIPKLHGVRSADFIRDNPDFFGFLPEVAAAVAVVVEHHGDRSLHKIASKYDSEILDVTDLDSDTYPEVNYAKLASIFRLSDMMDVTYKRISVPIIKLNYDSKFPNSKTIARQLFRKANVNSVDKTISLKTWKIRTPHHYQALIIAVDMMNKELIDTKTKENLTTFGLPNKFRLGENPMEQIVEKFKNERETISKFDDNCRLIVTNISEGDLTQVYTKYQDILAFSPCELDQLKNKSSYTYTNATKKPMEEIGNRLREIFGYSIKQLKITRNYQKDGSLIGFIEYLGLRKPKGLSVILSYDVTEKSSKAKFVLKNSDITEPIKSDSKGVVTETKDNKLKGVSISLALSARD